MELRISRRIMGLRGNEAVASGDRPKGAGPRDGIGCIPDGIGPDRVGIVLEGLATPSKRMRTESRRIIESR